MYLIEVLLAEVAGGGDPGPRSVRPERLDVTVRVQGERAGERWSGAAVVTFPAGLQSPWNVDVLARRMADATGALLGVQVVDTDGGGAGEGVGEIVHGWEVAVLSADLPPWQRAGVRCIGAAMEVAMHQLRSPGGAGKAVGAGMRDGHGIVAATSSGLAGIVADMGRCVWKRTEPYPQPSYTEYDVPGIATLGKNSLDSYLLEREAHRLGLRTVRLRGVDLQVEDADGRAVGFHCTTGPVTSRYVAKVCGDKQLSRALLRRAGVPVPRGRAFDVADQPAAADFARSVGWPVVVKPAEGKGGVGVTTDIRDSGGLERALADRARAGGQVIVEEHVDGADYRFLVVGDEVASVVRRTPGGVVGDGRCTVSELVLATNLARLRNPHLRTRLLRLDQPAVHLLGGRGMTADSVPADGEHVSLTTAGNVARGGDSVEVLGEVHPSLLETAVRAVRAVPGLEHAGVDVLAADHRRPLDEQTVAVCELNALPAMTLHHYPAHGPARNVSHALMKHYVRRHGLTERPRPETATSVRMRVHGATPAAEHCRFLAEIAVELELSGWARSGEGGERVEAEVTGPLDTVSALTLRAIFGSSGAVPELVETSPIDTAHSGDFRVYD